jgi:8-oxo-dGTP pyrophosphatase MutT (NUDIX family)
LKIAGKSAAQSSRKILAAGGILFGKGAHEGQIAIVRRPRYGGEISLPKGKIKKGETEVFAALREVLEETGFEAKIKEYAGSTHYLVGDLPKVVSYFLMEAEGEEAMGSRDEVEIEAVEWTTPQAAVAMLTHEEDRALIRAVFALPR